ncbi:hypothetical protein ACAG26_02770 [Mycobacterium sp. pUA109]|uniref:hypothetical protein n=1 Tax=Mycobacterium sp. pUA109 TaxID=3238982 RepID=UPI00351B403F
MGKDPERYIVDFSDDDGAAEYRQRIERARAVARQRYHDYLAATFDRHGDHDPRALADVALDALTGWRDINNGQRCMCACHPRLPESDFHDYGFGCTCGQTTQERRRAWEKWFSRRDAFWQSPEGQRIAAAERAAEAELQAWLAAQDGVTVDSHGGLAPEQWHGEVDGHAFYFRERGGEWRIELDEGDVVAHGTTDIDGYGGSPLERAQFIVDTIRIHLSQTTCTLHTENLSALEALLGHDVRWCPACGTRLPGR